MEIWRRRESIPCGVCGRLWKDRWMTGIKMSLVMEVEYGAFRMLLTGDIDEQAERQLAATGQWKQWIF